MKAIDSNICKKLFSLNYWKTSHEKFIELDKLAHTILQENSWEDFYACFDNYLRNDCKTEDNVINCVCFFVHYVGLQFKIPSQYDPYDLVGYIYSMVDLEKRWTDCDVFDDFANQALRIDLYNDPYYQFWRDPKIIEIAEKYKKERKINHDNKGDNSKTI